MTTKVKVTSPAKSYTDYCIMYRKMKGTIKGCYTLLTFCRRLNGGKTVSITEINQYNKDNAYYNPLPMENTRVKFILE